MPTLCNQHIVGYRCTTVVSLSIASISSMTADYRHYTSYCFESTIRDEQVSQSVRHSRGRPRLRLRAGMKEGRNRVKEGKPEESEVSRNFNRVRQISRPNSTASIGCSGDLSNYYTAPYQWAQQTFENVVVYRYVAKDTSLS
jgi:hypothetical protein